MYRLAYRNFGDHESLVTTFTVDARRRPPAAIRWLELRDPNGSPSVYQQATYAPDASYRFVRLDRHGPRPATSRSATASPTRRSTRASR